MGWFSLCKKDNAGNADLLINIKLVKSGNIKLPCYYTDMLVVNGLRCDCLHHIDDTVIYLHKNRFIGYKKQLTEKHLLSVC